MLKNFDWENIVTPVKADILRDLLIEAKYDWEEINFLHRSFTQGFDLGYWGPMDRRDTSPNIPFTVGNKYQLWEKMMDEIEMKRFAGPYKFDDLPFANSRTLVQSPCGLVPKVGNKTRLIFHLSYKFKNGNESINYWTPEDLSSVKYNDLDNAVKNCLGLLRLTGLITGMIFFSKSDLKSAFRMLPLLVCHRCLLILKAQHPITGEWFYFIDLCLPFGASISCVHFQRFSNALKAIVEYRSNKLRITFITNYLDDFLFIYFTEQGCNQIAMVFIKTCKEINFPVFARQN